MYTLLSGLYNYCSTKPEYKILLVGLDNAGKSTLLEQIKKSEKQKYMNFDKIPPTIGLNIAKVEKRRGNFVFWDVGG